MDQLAYDNNKNDDDDLVVCVESKHLFMIMNIIK